VCVYICIYIHIYNPLSLTIECDPLYRTCSLTTEIPINNPHSLEKQGFRVRGTPRTWTDRERCGRDASSRHLCAYVCVCIFKRGDGVHIWGVCIFRMCAYIASEMQVLSTCVRLPLHGLSFHLFFFWFWSNGKYLRQLDHEYPANSVQECMECIYIWKECIYIHAYVHMYMHMYTCTCICTYVHAYVHMYMHMCICTCICTYVHVYVHMYIHIYAYMYMYICMYIHIYVHVYIQIYVHVYIHTYMESRTYTQVYIEIIFVHT